MRKALLVFCLTGLLPTLLCVANQTFTFALPEAEGRISLGVYDASGRLVRTLFTAAEEKDFQVGLNGLITAWDGKNDAGESLPAGKYHVKGWVVPDSVQAEGVAYHFNDWIIDETSPRISGIGALAPVTDGQFWLFGFRPGREAAESVLWTYCDPEVANRWALTPTGNLAGAGRFSLLEIGLGAQPTFFPIPAGLHERMASPQKVTFLAANPDVAVIARSREEMSRVYSWNVTERADNAGFRPPGEWTEPFYSERGAIWRGLLYLRVDSTPELVARPYRAWDIAKVVEPQRLEAPAGEMRFDANEAALVGWTAEGIWLYRGKTFEPAAIAELPAGFAVSAGPEETLWVAGRSGPDVVVRQHAFNGELLREMKIREEFAEHVHIFASKSSLSFYLLLQSSHWSRQTLRGYRPAGPAGETSETSQVDWEVFFDKTIENSRRFGLKDGVLVADAGNAPQPDRQKIGLPEDSLTGKKGSIVVTAVSRKDGLWLASGDGLPLRHVNDSGVERVMVAPGAEEGALRLFSGDGVVVAEYLLSGLTGLAPIDAGEVEWP